MRKIKKICLIATTLIIGCNILISANNTQDEIKIALDAGHYYEETYKCSPDGYLEVDYNMNIVKDVKRIIETKRPNVKVVETNPNGNNKGRADRGLWAVENNVDLLVSFHMEAKSDRKWQSDTNSTHTIVDNNSSQFTKDLANRMISKYSKRTGFPLRLGGVAIRGDGRDQISMLDTASKGGVPAILIEMGFMDNKWQANYFRSKEGISNISSILANIIIEEYIDVKLQNTSRVVGGEIHNTNGDKRTILDNMKKLNNEYNNVDRPSIEDVVNQVQESKNQLELLKSLIGK